MMILRPMRVCVLVLSSLFFTTAHGQNDSVLVQPQRVKILSWNIYMLPGFLGKGKLHRSEAIGKLLAGSEYDVIVFQEAFHAPARKKISRYLKDLYPYEAGPANASTFSVRTNSGLWIFSRFPIIAQKEIMFGTRSGIDALSKKGGLLIEVDIHGQRLQIIATHLQNSGDATFKQHQCRELFNRLLQCEQRPGVPQIICGDFNIDRHGPEGQYRGMLETLQANDYELAPGSFSYDRLTNDLDIERGEKQELIDFILTRNNTSGLKHLHHRIKILRHRWHEKHQDLSDHYALETELEFQHSGHLLAVSDR